MATATELLASFKNALGTGFAAGGSKTGWDIAKSSPNFYENYKKSSPAFKGMYTGFQPQRNVDLSVGFGVGPAPSYVETPKTEEFKPETKSPTTGMFGELLSPEFEQFQQRQSQRRKEENLYDAMLTQQMFQNYIPAMERLAKQTRLTDYQLGLMADIQSPTRQQARASAGQQQMATAAGAEAAMLGAVNDAAYKNAMANIAGLQSGMRRG